MLKLDTSEPGTLQLTSQGAGLLGWPSLLAAALLLALATGRFDDLLGGPLEQDLRLVLGVMGLVMLLFGLLLAGGRRGIRISQAEQAAARWWGLFMPLKSTSYPLHEFSKLKLTREVSRNSKSNQVYFPVRLEGQQTTLQLDRPTDYHQARQLAEAVARFVRLPMADASSGEELVREPEHLDESFSNRMRRLGQEIELPPAPPDLRSTVLQGGELVIELPGRGLDLRQLMPLFIVGIFFIFGLFSFGAPFLNNLPEDPRILLLIGGTVLLAIGIPVTVLVRKAMAGRGGTRVHLSRAGLRLEQGRKVREIAGDELEELTLVGRDMGELLTTLPDGSARVSAEALDSPEIAARLARDGSPPTLSPKMTKMIQLVASLTGNQRRIMVRSDRETLELGQGLSTAELGYLWALMARKLCE